MMQTPESDKEIMKAKLKAGLFMNFVWFDVTCSLLVIQVPVTRKV
jgi:hypothetical protein